MQLFENSSDGEHVLYTPVRALFDSLPIDLISQWWCPAESDEKNPSQFFDHLSKWWWNKHVNVPTRQKCLEIYTAISNLTSFGSIGLKPNQQYREVESINLKVMGYLNWLVSINHRQRIKIPPPEILHGYPKITIYLKGITFVKSPFVYIYSLKFPRGDSHT